MDYSQTKEIALTLLSNLSDIFEQWPMEVELDKSVLTFKDDQGSYVLHYHQPSKQLWYASTNTGAFHFTYKDQDWCCTKTNRRLADILKSEFGRPISL